MSAFKDLDIAIQGIMNRLEKEILDLKEKYDKLEKFIYTELGEYTSIVQSLSFKEQDLLKEQLKTMYTYHTILTIRLRLLNEKYSS